MKHVISLAIGLATFTIVSTSVALGAGNVSCQPIYGGGQVCVQAGNVSINKKVSDPKDPNKFNDNISPDNPFAPNQPITFQLFVTNVGDQALPRVTVRDVFPQFVEFVSGDGNFDTSTRTVTATLDNLAPKETRKLTINAKIVGANQLTKDTVCVVNEAIAQVNGQVSKDIAQFCIAKQAVAPQPVTKGGLKVLPPPQVTVTPPTGPEMLALVGLIPTGVLGFFLRKSAKGQKSIIN